jgi:hypothetical protein
VAKFNRRVPKFWRKLLDPSSGQKRRCNADSSEILVAAYQVTHNDIPVEDSNPDYISSWDQNVY